MELSILNKTSSRNKFSKEKIISSDTDITTDIRAIAIYLPQFHAIEENSRWWGEGFTEWTNVRSAESYYQGHYQPHVTHSEIGNYDLNDESVLERQAEMAREHGIEGFCFYYYWFQGKRLLEMPTDRLLATGKPDFPFCFCWANENWTRTWDGGDQEVLMSQDYSDENNEKIIRDIIPAFKDRRYIRVDGRPLFIVYRPTGIPNFPKVAKLWRKICREEGVGEIYLCGKRSFSHLENSEFGLDASIQFPPLLTRSEDVRRAKDLQCRGEFRGHIHDYRELAALNAFIDEKEGKIFSGICPSWDNTARRKERATSWINSNPENYYRWLKAIVERSRKAFEPQERFIFINAWNEWAEGCHLEPDAKYGYAWLNATKEALCAKSVSAVGKQLKVLVIGHDAHLAGAQTLLLSLLQEWNREKKFEVKVILRDGGVLREGYEKQGDVKVITDFKNSEANEDLYSEILKWAPDIILSSTVTNGQLLAQLRQEGFHQPIITYTHELQNSIERWATGKIMEETLLNTDFFLAGSPEVAKNLISTHDVNRDKVEVVNGFIDSWDESQKPSVEQTQLSKNNLGIKNNDLVVFGCGTTDWRKGTDLFLEIAKVCIGQNENLKFVWIGGDAEKYNEIAISSGLHEKAFFLANTPQSRRYYYCGDIFLLSSREDPFPLVALEAADAGLPIVCFEGAGGIPSFVAEDAGVTVPYEQIRLAAEAVLELASNHDKLKLLGEQARKKVRERHTTPIAAKKIAHRIIDLLKNSNVTNDNEPLVSVIVPNYNHSKYLPDRLESIAKQKYKNIEIILLDDASTDDSVNILEDFTRNEPRARLIINESNSGSTFKQWKKGISEANGKFIWIAESDDKADVRLLKNLVDILESDSEIMVATCQLRMMDTDSNIGGTPDEWLGELDSERWRHPYINDGHDEILEFLSKKNTILNASGVVFRSLSGVESLVDDRMRLCADWLFWVRMLSKGKIAYTPQVLNYWRLQSSNARNKAAGVMESEEGEVIMDEIAEVLGVDLHEKERLKDAFRKKCAGWLKDNQ
jgi:glycosyltransferase involved in cell wall biosynthesis